MNVKYAYLVFVYNRPHHSLRQKAVLVQTLFITEYKPIEIHAHKQQFREKKTHECGIRQRICVYQWGAAAIHVLPSVSIVVLLWWYYIDFMWSRIKFECFFSLASSSSSFSSSPKMFFFSSAVDETPSLRFHCIYVNVFLGNKFDGFYIANMYRSIWFTSESRSKIFFISTRTFPKSKTFLQNAPIFD